jgi:protein-tyrosine phosphatase
MIDLHCHLIPGVDDGPPTLEAALEMARAAVAGGTRQMVATPHIDHHWGVEPQDVAPAVARLRAELDSHGIPLDVLPGGELALARFPELGAADLDAIRLGGGPYLLVESPHTAAAGDFHRFVATLAHEGEPIVLAHPERCPTFIRRPERLRQLVEEGVLCSVTGPALEGRFGGAVRRFALDLLAEGLVHNIASDSHDAAGRPPDMLGGLIAADAHLPGILGHADWLTRAVPEAIVHGSPLPERPPLPRRRRRRLLLRRRG